MVNDSQGGVTYVELLVFVAFGSLIIVALILMITSTFRLSREQLEQGAITEEARVQLERLSDEIRNAQYVDCNLDDDTADAGEHWLYSASDFEIIVLSNVDDDAEAERLRYFVDVGVAGEEQKLKRGVMQAGASLCDWTGTENVQVVMDSLRNEEADPDIPLFRYYASGSDGAILTSPVQNLSSVLRIRLELRIDEALNTNQNEVEIVTDVVPRAVRDPGACVDRAVDLQRYNYTSATIDFADEAFANCQSYCLGNASLGPGQCCPWSVRFSWQGNPSWYIWASCQCADTYLPPDMIPESVNQSDYTTYVEDCLAGARCGGRMGKVVCDAGCLDAPGSCVCACPNGFLVTTACNDGVDNDGDGAADCSACIGDPNMGPDPGCVSPLDSSEWGATECDDGIDNDGCDGTDFKVNGSGDDDCGTPLDNEDPCTSSSPFPSALPTAPPLPP